MPKKSELVDVSVLIRAETDKAILISEGLNGPDGKEIQHWLPRSQIEIEPSTSISHPAVVTLPRWLCEEKGLTID